MRTFIVDAFTDHAFSGNPAGVVLLEAPVGAEWMQRVATELKHSETAFVQRRADGDYDLRWFTPSVEVDLCGHATLASTHVLATVTGDATGRPFTFHTRSGVLTATASTTGIALDFPAMQVVPVPAPAALAAAFDLPVQGVYSNGVDLLIETAAADHVVQAVPDLPALRAIECRGLMLTAVADPGADHDFVSRFFAPSVGVDEDPVTGSAHCALGPFWAARLGRTELTGWQASQRGGRVLVSVRGGRVTLTGTAVTVLRGELLA